VAVKDFGSRPLWLRLTYGRPSLRREARAYQQLAGLRGVPRLVGFEGPDRLVVERVAGRPLAQGDAAPATVLDNAARVLGEIHARGVAVTDLHRSNLLVAHDGRVCVVDFAMARLARDPGRPGPLVRTLKRLDLHALARIRAHHLGEPEPELRGWLGLFYRVGRHVKRSTSLHRWPRHTTRSA